MIMLHTILYYILASSAVLFYGIGIHRIASIKGNDSEIVLSAVKALSTTASTTSLSYLLVDWLLIPAQLTELFPLVTILVFLVISLIIEIFLGVGLQKSPLEFSVPFLSTLLGMGEGISLAHAVVISCSCILSFYLLIIIFHSVKERVSFYAPKTGLKSYSVILLSLAVVILAVCGWNTSWFNFVFAGGSN
ncbi:hypothetical protein [Treponema zioleckii]|uniref:hypothetical protein n=1 Tax=Treponema zioleckii TaxID=331680 RepID=UPI00168AEE65|nr:hypothetical protein [Treponema zioleckii]